MQGELHNTHAAQLHLLVHTQWGQHVTSLSLPLPLSLSPPPSHSAQGTVLVCFLFIRVNVNATAFWHIAFECADLPSANTRTHARKLLKIPPRMLASQHAQGSLRAAAAPEWHETRCGRGISRNVAGLRWTHVSLFCPSVGNTHAWPTDSLHMHVCAAILPFRDYSTHFHSQQVTLNVHTCHWGPSRRSGHFAQGCQQVGCRH